RAAQPDGARQRRQRRRARPRRHARPAEAQRHLARLGEARPPRAPRPRAERHLLHHRVTEPGAPPRRARPHTPQLAAQLVVLVAHASPSAPPERRLFLIAFASQMLTAPPSPP